MNWIPWVFWIWLEEDWMTWVMFCSIASEEWLLTLAALINTLLVLVILFWPEAEEENKPYVPKKKGPPKPPKE